MRSPGEIWRQRLWVWVPALLFFLANALAFTVYRFGFADRVASLQASLKEQQERLSPLTAREQKLQGLLARSRSNQMAVEKLYAESFSTRKRRLTNITGEVKSLARRAGLDPRSFSYPEQQIQQYGLVKRSFVFSVQGTYLELRKFINLLEMSGQFLTLEEITLSEAGGGQPAGRGRGAALPPPPPNPGEQLHISLTLSTLFAQPADAEPLPVVARRSS